MTSVLQATVANLGRASQEHRMRRSACVSRHLVMVDESALVGAGIDLRRVSCFGLGTVIFKM
jgi:hypothetical protein